MKVALITGANKGIGFETAKQLAELGCHVYIGSRDKLKGLKAVEKLKAFGLHNINCIELDVTNTDSIQSAKRELESKVQQLDVLINNAGIAGLQPQNISTGDIENLRRVFDTNFFGAVNTTQHFINLLQKASEPRIVNVSSSLASLTLHSHTQNPVHSMYDAYSCSKTALNAFTVLLAKEFKDTNFKINAVEPGYTATDLNHFQGTQTVEQAAKKIIKYAMLGEDGPTGKFFKDDIEDAW